MHKAGLTLPAEVSLESTGGQGDDPGTAGRGIRNPSRSRAVSARAGVEQGANAADLPRNTLGDLTAASGEKSIREAGVPAPFAPPLLASEVRPAI